MKDEFNGKRFKTVKETCLPRRLQGFSRVIYNLVFGERHGLLYLRINDAAGYFTRYRQLILIFNAAAVGHGARTKDINRMAIRILICALMGKPLPAISTALLAKISTGT